MRKKIAITGGIGSGKSLLVAQIRELGYEAFSCDEIYADLIESSEYVERILKEFPSVVENNKIDRKKLSKIVFSDESQLLKLNQIAHPMIMDVLTEKMNVALTNQSIVFAEVPLLFENGYEKNFDEIFVVLRNQNLRITALQKRDGSSKEEILNKFAAQFDYDKNLNLLKKNTIRLFYNNNDRGDLKKQLLTTLNQLSQ